MIENIHEVMNTIEKKWDSLRLMVVGDVMLDQYIWGEVGRISPEAPVPVVRTTHRSEQPGGAANVAMNLARMGAQTLLAGFTGGDQAERSLVATLEANGIVQMLVACDGFPTITKLRIIGGRQQMLRLDSERQAQRTPADYRTLLDRVLSELPGCHAVVLSDYAKGVLDTDVCQKVIEAARRIDIPVVVDPKGTDFSRYRGATTVCPNLAELSLAMRMSGSSLESILTAAEEMVRDLDLEFLVATLSEAGLALVRPGNRLMAPAVARQVFDVSGAGDTVIATMALCLASNLKPELGAQIANLAAGVVVGKVGTAPVERHELLAALAPDVALHAVEKVVTRQELVSRCSKWKANGDRVVFANGCFDLLHVGHISLLEESRRAGDRLVVAVNSDASVRALKGSSRPIVGERERARVLAALAAVDAVVIFEEPTPLELIVVLKPHVLVKGGDYDLDRIVGAREVHSWGGEVRIVPTVQGVSTSQLIARGAGE